MSGRLIGVVGPSGVGKDTVMEALANAVPEFSLVRRFITRKPGLGGEDYEPVSEEAFARMKGDGGFCIDWQAHGLHYGIPSNVVDDVAAGDQLLVNLSRSVLGTVNAAFPHFVVLNITASPETLAERLKGRGRESVSEIAARLERSASALPSDVETVTISNDGLLDDTVRTAVALLQPVRA